MATSETCPICGRKPDARFRPFCTARCADVDLGRWLTESYRIPAGGPLEDDTPEEPDEAG